LKEYKNKKWHGAWGKEHGAWGMRRAKIALANLTITKFKNIYYEYL
jgi:hypothetical protein